MANTIDFLVIDGERINLSVLSGIDEIADVLDTYANRTDDMVLHRGNIGVFFNYQNIKFADQNDTNYDAYERVWDILTQPKDFHTITIANLTFRAYISSIKRKISYFNNNRAYHKGMQCNFTCERPSRQSF